MECCTLTLHDDRGSLKSFRGDPGKVEVSWFCIFLRETAKKGGLNFSWGSGEGGVEGAVTSIETII